MSACSVASDGAGACAVAGCGAFGSPVGVTDAGALAVVLGALGASVEAAASAALCIATVDSSSAVRIWSAMASAVAGLPVLGNAPAFESLSQSSDNTET